MSWKENLIIQWNLEDGRPQGLQEILANVDPSTVVWIDVGWFLSVYRDGYSPPKEWGNVKYCTVKAYLKD